MHYDILIHHQPQWEPNSWYIYMDIYGYTWIHTYKYIFIQYFVRNWPWYRLRGLHIRITWFSLYGIRIPLFSLYGIHMPLFSYMVILPIVVGGALLWAAMDSPLSQGPLLWRHNDMTVIVTPDTRGRERDTRQRLDNANARRFYRLSIDKFFVGFNAICYTFLRNNLIYIEGRNCRLSRVPGLFNKCLGLRHSDTLSSRWLGWRRHAHVAKPFFGKSLDLWFQSFTIVVLTIYTAWLRDTVRPGRWLPSGRLPVFLFYIYIYVYLLPYSFVPCGICINQSALV